MTTMRARPVVPAIPTGVVRFVALAFAVSWAAWGCALAVAGPVADVALVAGSFGPSLAAVALLARSGGAREVRRALRMLVRLRGALGATTVAAVVPLAVAVTAVLVDRVLGGETTVELPPPWAVPVVVGYVLVLGGPLGEELGWRGHLLPALESRVGPTRATLVVGAVWTAWHLPLFLVPGTVQSSLPLWLFAAQILTTSFVYTWLAHLAPHSLAPALAFHTSFNVTVGLVLLQPAGDPATRPLVIALVIVSTVALGLTRTATFRGADRTRPGRPREGSDHDPADTAPSAGSGAVDARTPTATATAIRDVRRGRARRRRRDRVGGAPGQT